MANDIRISIVIPLYNAEGTIIQTLNAVEKAAGDDVEIICINDGSTDSSTASILEFAQHSRLQIHLIHQKQAGPATARNAGVACSNGEIIIFLDSDCLPAENWIEEMVCLLGEDISGCYCWNKAKNTESVVARYIHYEMTKRHEGMVDRDIDAISTYSSSFLKQAFLDCGGFDTRYREASGEDFDLTFNMNKAGYRLRFVDTTFVHQYHPHTWREYFIKQFKRGYWSTRLHLKTRRE